MINLKDPKWAVAVEVCLEGQLTSFCVNDHQDERALEAVMNKVFRNGRKPSTITSKFGVSQ